MNKKDVTILNIDDFIRQEKREGRRVIHWPKKQAHILQQFEPDFDVTNQGVLYMGVRHYYDK